MESAIHEKALAHVLLLFHSSDAADDTGLESCSYGVRFDELWMSLTNQHQRKDLLIVGWDQVPCIGVQNEVVINHHLNPLSWAICALYSETISNVAILDLFPLRHRSSGLIYSILGDIKSRRIPWLRLLTLTDLGHFLIEHYSVGRNAGSGTEHISRRDDLLQLLASVMRLELTKEAGDNDRHAIQNIVGPLVLLGRDYLAKKGVTERALLQVFEVTGLLPKQLADGVQSSGKINDESWGKQPLRLLLVDDQADCGWTDWVRANLPTSNPGLVILESVDVLASPDALLDRLLVEWRLMGDSKDRRFALQLAASGKEISDRQPVLLLDLRLHSLRSAESEADFIKKLLPLCERFQSDGKAEPFAWPGFSAQEIQSVQQWCEHPKRETPDHLVALSLLPRLIALMDMSLPIIIFSSTGQRSLIEKFKPYGNIITDFEKPRFFGRDATNVIAETHATFAASVERAVRFVEARGVCSSLALTGRVTPSISASRKAKVAHLFIDESGNLESSDYFSIGAFIVMAESQDSLNRFSAELENTIRWGFSSTNFVPPSRADWANEARWNDTVLRQIPTDYLAKNKPDQWSWNQYRAMMNDVLGDINHRLTTSGFQWAAASFQYKIDDKNTYDSGTGGLDSIFDHDMLFRKGLRDLLRFVITDCPVVGEFLKRPDTRFSVDVASRELRAAKFSEKEYRDDMENRFAARFRRTRDGHALMTMNGYDVFPLVASLFTDLGVPLSRLDKARAVILHDFQSVSQFPARMRVPEALPLQIHYLADWLAKCACWREADRPKKVKSWFERGFIQERTQNFDEMWGVVSEGKRGLITDAIHKMRHFRLSDEQALTAGVSAERYVRETASGWPKMLKGIDFSMLAERI